MYVYAFFLFTFCYNENFDSCLFHFTYVHVCIYMDAYIHICMYPAYACTYVCVQRCACAYASLFINVIKMRKTSE